jgi:hypothetical protein
VFRDVMSCAGATSAERCAALAGTGLAPVGLAPASPHRHAKAAVHGNFVGCGSVRHAGCVDRLATVSWYVAQSSET